MTKKVMVQIAAVLFIVLLIIGIWVFKNQENMPDETEAATAAGGGESPAEINEDFLLDTQAIDLEQLLTYQLPIIIDFGADSCVPCKEMAPVLKMLNAEMQGKAIIKFADVWKYAGTVDGFPVQVIPTQVFINTDGTPYVPGDDVDIKFVMYNFKDTGEHAFTAHQGGLTESQMRAILADMGVPQ